MSQARFFAWLAHQSCVDCGETDPLTLEADHVRGDKGANISRLIADKPWAHVERELALCEVRCRNCHAIVTHIRAKTYRARLAGYVD